VSILEVLDKLDYCDEKELKKIGAINTHIVVPAKNMRKKVPTHPYRHIMTYRQTDRQTDT